MRLRNTRSWLVPLCLMLGTACNYETIEAEPITSTEQPLYLLSTRLWPEGNVQVCWENATTGNAQARGWVASAVQQTWEQVSNVRFVGWTQCGSNNAGAVRIRVADETAAPHTVGLGTALAGKSNGVTLNFTFAKWGTDPCARTQEYCVRTIAVHEFGHVLGFAHEQNRPDTPVCDDAPTGTNGDLLFGPWDLSSVMNYCNPNWDGHGILSTTDTAGAHAAYGTRKLQDFGYDAGSWHADKHVRLVADVNDDGRDDIVGFGDAGVYVAISNGSGFAAPQLFIADFGYNSGWRVEQHPRLMGDVNGDGRSDVVAFGNAGAYVSLSGSNRFYPWQLLNDLGYDSGWRVDQHVRTLADVNADGRADIVAFGNAGVYVALSQGASFAAPQLWVADFGYDSGWRNDKHVRVTADVNDDGRDDIVGFGNAGVYVAISTGTGFAPPQLFSSDFGYDNNWRVDQHPRIMADVNADGRADIVAFGSDGVKVSLSGSNQFYPAQLATSAFGYGSGWRVTDNPRLLADVTGDGRPDIVGYANNGVIVSAALGGASFGPATQWALRYGSADSVTRNGSSMPLREFVRTTGDWDGDGSAGLIGFGPDGLHTTDMKIHLVPRPSTTNNRKPAAVNALGEIEQLPFTRSKQPEF